MRRTFLVVTVLGLMGYGRSMAIASPILLESAAMGLTFSSGQAINATDYVAWRFSIDYTLAVFQVGGNLAVANNEVFAEIVPLDTIDAFPMEGALAQIDKTGTPIGPIQVPSTDARYSLSVLLEPGSYALVFGGGMSSGQLAAAMINHESQPHIEPTTAESFIFGSRSQASGPLDWQTGNAANMRFVVQGSQLAGTADFDFSGIIDGDDLTRWNAHFGSTSDATIATGSADLDGDTDATDFLLWQQQFGNQSSDRLLTVGIPEPATDCLLFACIVSTPLLWHGVLGRFGGRNTPC